MLEKSYSGLISSIFDGSLESAFFIISPFKCRCFPATNDTYFTLSFGMNQNQNVTFCRKTDINIAFFVFRIVGIQQGKQKGIIENRFPFSKAYPLMLLEIYDRFNFIPFKCKVHPFLPGVLFPRRDRILCSSSVIGFVILNLPSGITRRASPARDPLEVSRTSESACVR